MKVLIPAAGDGTRFKQAGYEMPKLLVPVAGRPMIERVLENVAAEGIVIHRLPEAIVGVHNVKLDAPTRGALDTLLHARDQLNPEEPVLIANCDQLIAFDPWEFVENAGADGTLVTFRSEKSHHSYVQLEDGRITAIAEKQVVSHHAVAGVYFFRQADAFFDAAERVVSRNDTVLGEFYLSSAIAEMIEREAELSAQEAPVAILGTPEELQLFEVAVEVAKWAR